MSGAGGAPAARRVIFGRDPTPEEVAAIASRVARAAAVRAGGSLGAAVAPPFLVLTPLGASRREALRGALAERGARVRAARGVADWPEAATALYVRSEDDAALRRALAFEWLWRELFGDGGAERWELDGMDDYRALLRDKARVRAELPSLSVRVSLPGFSFWGALHPFHLPDEDRLGEEAACLEAYLPTSG